MIRPASLTSCSTVTHLVDWSTTSSSLFLSTTAPNSWVISKTSSAPVCSAVKLALRQAVHLRRQLRRAGHPVGDAVPREQHRLTRQSELGDVREIDRTGRTGLLIGARVGDDQRAATVVDDGQHPGRS